MKNYKYKNILYKPLLEWVLYLKQFWSKMFLRMFRFLRCIGMQSRTVRSCYCNCHILDPAVYVTENGVSSCFTCYDVVSCDSWLSATWTIRTIRQSVMVYMPHNCGPWGHSAGSSESCWVLRLFCVRWDLLWLTLPVH